MTLNRGMIYFIIMTLLAALVPIESLAASENRITKVITAGVNDLLDVKNAPVIVLDLKDELESGDTFYLNLEGAKWHVGTNSNEIKGQIVNAESTDSTPTLETQKINETELQIRVKDGTISSAASLRIPLVTELTGKEAYVSVNNNNTTVSSSTHLFAKTMDPRGKVTAGETSASTGSAKMADLIIEEPYSQAFAKSIAAGKSNKIQIELNSNDYEFALDMPELGSPSLKGIKGFDTVTGGMQNLRKIDAQTLELTLPDTSSEKYTGGFVLSGIVLRTSQKTPAAGNVTITAKGDLVYTSTLNVLKVVDYGIALTVPEKCQTVSGHSKTVSFTLEEKVAQSLIRERLTTFTFTNGAEVKLTSDQKAAVRLNGTPMLFYPVMQNNKAIGFEVPQLPAGTMKYTFELTLNLPVAMEGEMQILADGRSLIGPLSAAALDVIPPVSVTLEPVYLKLGFKDQKGGKITITETNSGQIRQDAHLILQFEDSPISFTSLPQVKVTSGDIRLGTPRYVPGGLEVPIIRRSNTASVIEIKDFVMTVNQVVAEGTYNVQVGGNALSDFAFAQTIDPVKEGGFMIVTKEEPSNVKQQVTFQIGQTFYTVGSVRKTMDAAPYIKNGRTMLPIKYVAYALGIPAENVIWNEAQRTVTIRGTSTIELKIGSFTMKVNGTAKQMSAPPEIKNSRTFVPVAEITRALGVETRWDEASQTVFFN